MNDFVSIRRFLRLIYLESRDKACNLRFAVAQRYISCLVKLKLLLIVTPKETSAWLDFMVIFLMFIALSTNGITKRGNFFALSLRQ